MTATITLQGFIAKEPEIRYTANGTPALTITVPDTPQKQNKDTGQWENNGPTTWWQITLWGTAADNAQPHLHKGTHVLITGYPHTETREHNGKTYTNPKISNPKVAIIPHPTNTQPTQSAYAGGFTQPQAPTQPQAAPQADTWGTNGWENAPADETPPF